MSEIKGLYTQFKDNKERELQNLIVNKVKTQIRIHEEIKHGQEDKADKLSYD